MYGTIVEKRVFLGDKQVGVIISGLIGRNTVRFQYVPIIGGSSSLFFTMTGVINFVKGKKDGTESNNCDR